MVFVVAIAAMVEAMAIALIVANRYRKKWLLQLVVNPLILPTIILFLSVAMAKTEIGCMLLVGITAGGSLVFDLILQLYVSSQRFRNIFNQAS